MAVTHLSPGPDMMFYIGQLRGAAARMTPDRAPARAVAGPGVPRGVLGLHHLRTVALEGALSEGQFSPDLMTRLLRTDWLRKALLIEAPLAVFMAHRVLQAAGGPSLAATRRGAKAAAAGGRA